MKKYLALASALAAMFVLAPADATTVSLPYQKSVTVQLPGVGIYDVNVSSGAYLNRCFASGGGDCIPHDEDVQLIRSNIGRVHRCLWTSGADFVAQSDTSSPTGTSDATGTIGFLFDFGFSNTIAGRWFRLRTTSPTGVSGLADFDVTWYKTLGNCANTGGTENLLPTQNPDHATFSNPGTLEQGRIPGYFEAGAPQSNCTPPSSGTGAFPGCPRYAIVTMFSGDPGSTFKLTICTTKLSSSCPTGS